MPLAAGTKLGPYEIISPLGAGGMGEVYRARDTRLERTVAVKILPTHLSAAPEARARFDREAKSISSLSHPNICQLFDVGHQDGTDFLVMEFLEGETLAARIAKGALPTEQVLKIGGEICDGLERAHKTGVIHRDLKPANIMLSKSGAKLMDFGLAKSTDAAITPASSLTQTLNSPGSSTPLTQAGTVVGTFQYMSPEQVEGGAVDARSDIFSLGAVLYEMATGKRAFEGKTSASVIAAILERDPAPISTIQPTSPSSLDRLVKSCLAKDPDERWQTAHDVKLQLQNLRDALSHSAYSGTGMEAAQVPGSLAAQAARTKRNRETTLLVLGTMLVSALVFSALGYVAHAPKPATVLQASIVQPETLLAESIDVNIALSPDGQKLAYVGRQSNDQSSLWVRSLDRPAWQDLGDTAEARAPFWSPDSKSLGFFAGSKLKKIELASGTVTTICDAPQGRGGSWGSQGTILFAPNNTGPLFMVSPSGGTPVAVTETAENTTNREPWFLPDGVNALFVKGIAAAAAADSAIHIVNTRTHEVRTLLDSASQGVYVEPGYVLFMRGEELLAQPFDAKKEATTGEARTLVQGVRLITARRAGLFTVAANGTLVYLRDSGLTMKQMAWYDLETGSQLGKIGEPARLSGFSLSPDDQYIAASISATSNSTAFSDASIWLYNLRQKTNSRLTFAEGFFRTPIWTPDSRSTIYGDYKKPGSLYRKSIASGAEPVAFPDTMPYLGQSAVSPDGQWMAMSAQDPRYFRIYMVPMVAGKTGYTFASAPNANFRGMTFSPDGKWGAYLSDETGRFELYVVAFPGPGGKWQVSRNGVSAGGWTPSPNKLAYMGIDQKLYVVDVAEKNGELSVVSTRAALGDRAMGSRDVLDLFSLQMVSTLISSDGKRILLAPAIGDVAVEPLSLITNWEAAIARP